MNLGAFMNPEYPIFSTTLCYPEPTPSQRKHQNDLVRKLNNAGKGRAGRKA